MAMKFEAFCLIFYTIIPIQWVRVSLNPGVKQRRREADHSLPSSDEVKNEWSYTSTPLIRLNVLVLV